MEKREKAIIPMTPAADHSEKVGYFVKVSAGEAAVMDSATERPYGLILDGEDTGGQDSIGLCGSNIGLCEVKLNGTVSQGDYLQLESDGAVIEDSGSGARVVVARATEDGVATELINAIILPPVYHAS